MDVDILVEADPDAPVFGYLELKKVHQANRFFIAAMADAGDHLGVGDLAQVIDGVFDDDGSLDLVVQGFFRITEILPDDLAHGVQPALEMGLPDKMFVLLFLLHGLQVSGYSFTFAILKMIF